MKLNCKKEKIEQNKIIPIVESLRVDRAIQQFLKINMPNDTCRYEKKHLHDMDHLACKGVAILNI